METSWRRSPLFYEINTWTWLHGLSLKYERHITLGTVPDADLDVLAGWGMDAIWLMGVWERSPLARQIAFEHPGLQDEYWHALPDFGPEDVVGSPYAVRRYEVDPHLGGQAELASLRKRLANRGMRLILDYVPNHVAHDHPWIDTNPECFLHGTESELAAQPDYFFRRDTSQIVFASGRDPYFPAWTDTAQLNAFSPILREKTTETLLDIAGQCDAVRCDMAMLVTNRIFLQTWGARAGNMPPTEFWHDVIPAIKSQYPNFLFMAEVYWDMEWELQQQGFDYTYDKRLYDLLKRGSVPVIIGHLQGDLAYQGRLVRLIENHDEARAAAALGPERAQPAAVLVTTLPGATLLHEGQFNGHCIKIPVQLGRRPLEPDNPAIEVFYRRLLAEANHPVYHQGDWQLRDVVPAWDQNWTHTSLIAYTWLSGETRRLVVLNYSPDAAQGRVRLADFGLAGRGWDLVDVLNEDSYPRDGDEMFMHGLYIDLPAWQAHIFEFR